MNTNSNALPHSLEGLLTHADWVRALARRLVRDDAQADDVAQEVWRTAIENPPRDDANPRGWLSAVARNAARGLKRGDRRRNDRERAGARPEALPSTARLVEEASLSRELAGLVLKLDEPYRTTMLLRWFREMEVDAIAAAQKLPRETVRTRLRRGLEIELFAQHLERGGREAWAWLAWPDGTSVRDREDVAAGTRAEVREAPKTDTSGPGQLVATGDAGGTSTATRSPLASGEAAGAPAAETRRTIDALVVDATNQPIAGLSIEWSRAGEPYWDGNTLHTPTTAIEIPRALRERLLQPRPEEAMDPADWKDQPVVWELLTKGEVPRVRATSDVQGRITARIPRDAVERIVLDPRRSIVAEAHDEARSQEIWIVATTVVLAGTVVDESGAPIAHASLKAGPVWDFVGHVVDVHSGGFRILDGPGTITDEQGRFRIERAPVEFQSVLEVFGESMQSQVLPVPAHDDLALQIVMKRQPVEERPHVRGIVVDQAGGPVTGAWVALGQDNTESGAGGRFDLEVTFVHAGTPLTAVRSGHQAAVLENFAREPMVSVEDVVLRLGPAPLTITGLVLEADGSPIPSCEVRLVDGTPNGTTDRSVEEVTASDTSIEKRTQADGAFVVLGLIDREYTLMAWHADRGFIARLEHVRAGSRDVVLRHDPSAFFAALPGRLVDSQGTSVEGAKIGISLRITAGPGFVSSHHYGAVQTGADGAFTLKDVPRTGVSLWVTGEGLQSGVVPMPDPRVLPITVVVGVQVRARLSVSDSSVTRVRFEDREGKVVRLKAYLLRTIAATNVIERRDGEFPSFDVPDVATTAVLMRADGSLVRRAPITIRRTNLLALDL